MPNLCFYFLATVHSFFYNSYSSHPPGFCVVQLRRIYLLDRIWLLWTFLDNMTEGSRFLSIFSSNIYIMPPVSKHVTSFPNKGTFVPLLRKTRRLQLSNWTTNISHSVARYWHVGGKRRTEVHLCRGNIILNSYTTLCHLIGEIRGKKGRWQGVNAPGHEIICLSV